MRNPGLTADQNKYDTQAEADACCTFQGEMLDEPNPRERGDDDGVEYADPRDYRDGLE